jgi:hypothetical protein
MVEMLLSAVSFGDVKDSCDAILRASKQQLSGYGVGQYEDSFTGSDNKIVLVDTVFPCVHMKVTDNASNIKKDFKFFDDEDTNRKRKVAYGG